MVLLWSIPIGTITDVSQIGLIAKLTPPDQRSAAIGLISGASSFGNMLGSLLLSFVVYNTLFSQLLELTVFLPFIVFVALLPLREMRTNIKKESKHFSL